MVSRTTRTPIRAPAPRRFAFFDVDGTLLPFKSMFDFQAYCSRRSRRWSVRLRHLAIRARFAVYELAGASRSYVNRRYYDTFRGQRPAQIRRLAEEWLAWRKAEGEPLLIAPAIAVLEAHRRAGAGIVLVSGSFNELLQPLAGEIGGAEILATRLEVVGGVYTGRILNAPMIGLGKRNAVRAFVREHGARAEDCFAYGDHWSDLDMLLTVGRPGVVAGDERLEAYARRNGWPVIATK